ncbi:ATP-binding protein [Tateyamaria armeniaca]|uniref:histidine kinase n=1 Tax=Tateyamaria armeniaca TaxID=2518930 RepID=A0ABW8V0U5_9RHOB
MATSANAQMSDPVAGRPADAPARPDDPPAAHALHEALIAQGAIAHVTAHDLRTPLNTMTGLVHLLKSQFANDLPDKALEYIDYMGRSVAQLEGLTAAFLEHTRGLATAANLRPVDMRRCIDAVLQAQHVDMPNEHIIISGPSWTQMADPDLLHLLMMHLLRNAGQHAHPLRKLVVSITLAPDAQTAHTLCIADTGTGFDPGAGHAMFLPVLPEPATNTAARLGLAICKEVCRRHGWQISAQSDGSTGAMFKIAFPPQD